MIELGQALAKIKTECYTATELAQMTGFDKVVVRNYLTHRGITYKRIYTNRIPEALKATDTTQYTNLELAEMFGCSVRTISSYVVQLNLTTRNSRKPKSQPTAPVHCEPQTQAQAQSNNIGLGMERVMTLWLWHTLNPT